MLSTIVLGIGGTGKWVLTDLKRSILEENGGKIPGNVSLLAFDLTENESPKIEREVFNLENGSVKTLTLDYEPSHKEFLNFSGPLTETLQDITAGKGNYPYIEKFLSKEEIKKFLTGRISGSPGAGQIRPLSRVSFFLKTEDIYKRIYDAVKTISAKRKEKEFVLTFIVSSLAGGTGCGTFMDFAHFLHHAFEKEQVIKDSYYVIGIFILPRGFEATIPNANSNKHFKVNCFSAFREMHRFITLTKHKTYYPGELSEYSQKFHLFDMVYLIDGTKIPKIKHYEGLCPAISEFILANINEGSKSLTELPNIIMNGIRLNISNLAGKFDIPIYSTFGIHKHIFEIEDIKIEFAHRLSKDILNYFIAQAPYPTPDSEVQNFMKGGNSTQLMRGFLYQIIENPGTVGTDKNSLKRNLKFGSKRDDIAFREMSTKKINLGRIPRRIPLPQVKRNAESLMERIIGSEKDMSTPANQIRTTHGVLNYYIDKHYEKFASILKEHLLEILNSKDRKGSLIHVYYFLEALGQSYKRILEETKKIFEEAKIDERINSYQKQINAVRKTKKYRILIVKLCELQQYKLLTNSIEKIIGMQKELSEKILKDVERWISTFEDGIKKVDNSQRELIRARHSKRNIKIWSFVTEPEDEFENKIYRLMREEKPLNEAEEKIKEKLPHIDFGNLTDPDQDYFKWIFDIQGKEKDSLSCVLPGEFEPFDVLKSDPIKWNYSFISNYLRLGKLQGLNNLTIADILLLKNVDAKDFALDLDRKSSILASYSDAKQVAGTKKAQGTEKIKKTLAEFNPASPGDQFVNKFKVELEKEQNSLEISQHDPYSITQLRTENYIKYSGFSNLSSLEDIYRKEGLNGPYHVFPEEKSALRIEGELEEVLDERPTFLNFKVVDLLRDEQLIINFAYALWKDWVKMKLSTGEYVIEIEEMGNKKEIPLGKNRIESLEFLLTDSLNSKKAKEEMEKKVSKLKESVNSKDALEKLIKDLRTFFTSNKIQYKKEKDEAEKDLLKVIKILIYDEIRRFEDLKDKI